MSAKWRAIGQAEVAFVLGAVGVYSIVLSIFMAVAPGSFFDNLGPFGSRNDHYTRDTATFMFAMGAGCVLAVRREQWRLPMLVITALQFWLHAINHLIDIREADPEVLGPIDFVGVFGIALVLSLALGVQLRVQRKGATSV